MVNFRKMTRFVFLAIIGTIGTLLILVNPTYFLLVLLSMFAVVGLARNMNFYKIVMIFKRYAREAARLRCEFRMRLHTGFKDSSISMDDETRTRNRTVGFVR